MKGLVRIRTDTDSFCFLHCFLIAIIVVSTDVISITGTPEFEAVYWGWKTILIKKCASPRTWHIRVSEKIAKAGILPMLPRAIDDWHKLKIFEKWSTVFGFMSHVSFKTQLACQTTKAWCDKVMMIWKLVLQMIWVLYGLKKLQNWIYNICWYVKCYDQGGILKTQRSQKSKSHW